MTNNGDGESKTSEELQRGTGNIYEEWLQKCANDPERPLWNFGMDEQYPMIQCILKIILGQQHDFK